MLTLSEGEEDFPPNLRIFLNLYLHKFFFSTQSGSYQEMFSKRSHKFSFENEIISFRNVHAENDSEDDK